MGDDKRKFLRFECLLPAEIVKIGGGKSLKEIAKVDEISREGLKLVINFDFNLNPGAKIDFKLSLPEREAATLVSGEIMWSKCKGNKWEIGIRILDMDKTAKAELLEWGYNKWLEGVEKDKQVN